MTTSARLPALPGELVEWVASHLDPKDLLNIRLVSKEIAAKSKVLMLKRCFGDLHIMVAIPASLERALALTARADLCAYMTTIVFYVDEPRRSWLNSVYREHAGQLDGQEISNPQKRVLRYAERTQLRAYQSVFDDYEAAVEARTDVQRLHVILRKLSAHGEPFHVHLTDLADVPCKLNGMPKDYRRLAASLQYNGPPLGAICDFHEGMLSWTHTWRWGPPRSLCTMMACSRFEECVTDRGRHEFLAPESDRALSMVLSSIADSAISVCSLSFRGGAAQPFKVTKDLRGLVAIGSRLAQGAKLSIHIHETHSYSIFGSRVLTSIAQDIMSAARFLQSIAPSLATLVLESDDESFNTHARDLYAAVFSMRFPVLKRLDLIGGKIYGSTVLDFFVRHKGTLQQYDFRDVRQQPIGGDRENINRKWNMGLANAGVSAVRLGEAPG